MCCIGVEAEGKVPCEGIVLPDGQVMGKLTRMGITTWVCWRVRILCRT